MTIGMFFALMELGHRVTGQKDHSFHKLDSIASANLWMLP